VIPVSLIALDRSGWLLCSFQGPPRGCPAGLAGRRSLTTQQHASGSGPTLCGTARTPTVGDSRSRAPAGPARSGRRSRPYGRCRSLGSVRVAWGQASSERRAAGVGPCRTGPGRDSLERRWSSRSFRYGYLVTTSPQSRAPPSTAPSLAG